MMAEKLEEWKNCVVILKCKKYDKKRWRNIEEVTNLTHVINYIVKF